MKKELDSRLVIALIVVIAVLAIGFLWKGAVGKKDTMSPLPPGGLPAPGAQPKK